MTELSLFIQSQINIEEKDLETILSGFSELTINKGKYLIRKGQFVTYYYFIKSGALRIYLDNDDKQVTGWLAFENDFFTELNSITSGQPTLFNFQAIETTVLYIIEKKQMDQLYKEFPLWQQFGRQIWEAAFLRVIHSVLSFQTMTAEERYLALMQQSDLIHRVPLKELASYLGITQTSLSRLRRKLNK